VTTEFDELGPGVFRRRYGLLDQNIGVVLGDSAALVIDTRSAPSHAAEVAAELRSLTNLPVGWVVNTHWHWDHVLGNSAFPGAAIWGHRRCREVLVESAADTVAAAKMWMDSSLHSELDGTLVVPPTDIFDRDVTIDLGSRVVTLSYRGRGHTDADLTARVDGVLFAGDLLEQGAPPAFGDSYPLAWPGTLAEHLVAAPPVVVPGHGDVMDAAAVQTQQEELMDVARRCGEANSVAELDLDGAPYPDEVMRIAWRRSLVERG
jgi:glyoxylase-like metal-dependent hydrolase (beta-lactamase superfamily II)